MRLWDAWLFFLCVGILALEVRQSPFLGYRRISRNNSHRDGGNAVTEKRGNQHTKKRRKSPLTRFARGLYAILVAFSAVIVLLWSIYKLTARQPSTAQPIAPAISSITSAPSPDPGDPPDPSSAPALVRKDTTWTFLLCAKDQVSSSTDTLMVCTYDTVNQKIGLVSIPRDTLVDRKGWKYHKINAAYASGGMEELMAAVSELLGIPIDHYVLINTKIFVELVDAVNGVDFDVPVHMSYDDPAQDLHIHYEPGLQHLTGQQALEVVRCRKNSDGKGEYPHNIYDAYPDADIGRTRTQQAMLKAIAKKALSKPQNVGQYMELLSQNVKTDLTLSNLLWFVEPVLGFNFDDLTTATFPGDGSVTYKGITYCYALDIKKSLEIINDCLNPYTTPVTADMVRMVQG